MPKPIVAIVGRPNVGKSTLFNRIIGERRAIVHDEPGVTRDRHYAESDWAGHEFILIDTGGYVPDSSDVFEKAIREQVLMSLSEADVVIFVVDSREGILPLDEEIATLVRRHARRVVLAVNKIDSEKLEEGIHDFHSLGLGEPHAVSAISGRMTGDLLDQVVEGMHTASDEETERPFQLAIIGRPNVGKSSITNAFLGTERSIVTDVPGTTRDAIDSVLKYHGQEITIIDTAGLRRRSRVKENIEFFSTLRTLKSIQRCDVALILIDATIPITHQDFEIISEAVKMNKGVVIAVNKWDLIEDKDSNTAKLLERDIFERIKMFDYIPVMFVSAMTKQRLYKLLDLCIEVHDERRKRIPTSLLNDTLLEVVRETPPPATPTGREVKVYYITQVREQPPVIVLFTNEPKYIPESYRRFVERAVRTHFGYKGVPLTVQFRQK